jgi:hypothetical protein
MRWFLLPLALMIGSVQSQEPTPSSGNTIEKPKSQSQKNEKRAAKDQRGTGASPLIVKVLPTQGANPPTPESAKKQHDYTSAEWWLVYITGTLAVFTLGLMLYTARLWGATVKLGEDAQKTSERQAHEMQESLRIAAIAAEAAKESSETARKEFFSAHRPRLVVRQISHIEDKGAYGIQYFIHNIGDSPAKVVTVSEKVWLPTRTENLRATPPYGPSEPVGVTLKSGHWMGRLHVPPMDMQEQFAFVLGSDMALDNIEKVDGILFLGFIEYEDQAGTTRNTAFLRQFDFKTERFNPIQHPDYEYQD